MPANPLSEFERVEIRVGIDRGETDGVIGARLGRCRSTINAEINRNGGRVRYCAVAAQRRAVARRARPKIPKLVADAVLAGLVAARLKAKDSPKTISIELARGVHGPVASVSHECIYQSLYTGRGLDRGLCTNLHLRRRRRKPRRAAPPTDTHSLGVFNPISARPAAAADRSEIGHLEGDLIVGAYNRSALITVFDRHSRYLWLAGVANKTADATYQSLLGLLARIDAPLRHTLTWDQGAEIARHHDLTKHRGIDIYIADPKSPWQRPTNENGNALIRRYVGKGTNLALYKPRHLRAIEHRINTTPRRIHNWATAHDIYTAAVAMTD